MLEIVLKGVVCRVSFRTKKSVVFIDEDDHERLYEWWHDNHIDTKLETLTHPITNRPCPQIQAESTAKDIQDGTPVDIKIKAASRNMKSGEIRVGIRTLSITPRAL